MGGRGCTQVSVARIDGPAARPDPAGVLSFRQPDTPEWRLRVPERERRPWVWLWGYPR